jgi:hypothetical protein
MRAGLAGITSRALFFDGSVGIVSIFFRMIKFTSNSAVSGKGIIISYILVRWHLHSSIENIPFLLQIIYNRAMCH